MASKAVEKAIADISKSIGNLTADIASIREHMLTRVDFPEALDAGLNPIANNLLQLSAQTRGVAERIEDFHTSLQGHTKETESLRQRLKLIEQHLGIDQEIAA